VEAIENLDPEELPAQNQSFFNRRFRLSQILPRLLRACAVAVLGFWFATYGLQGKDLQEATFGPV